MKLSDIKKDIPDKVQPGKNMVTEEPPSKQEIQRCEEIEKAIKRGDRRADRLADSMRDDYREYMEITLTKDQLVKLERITPFLKTRLKQTGSGHSIEEAIFEKGLNDVAAVVGLARTTFGITNEEEDKDDEEEKEEGREDLKDVEDDDKEEKDNCSTCDPFAEPDEEED